MKGHLKSHGRKKFSTKLNKTVRVQKQRLKNHKGLLKRVKIVNINIVRWDLVGTVVLNLLLLVSVILILIKVRLIWSVREELDIYIRQILTVWRNLFLTLNVNLLKEDTDLFFSITYLLNFNISKIYCKENYDIFLLAISLTYLNL